MFEERAMPTLAFRAPASLSADDPCHTTCRACDMVSNETRKAHHDRSTASGGRFLGNCGEFRALSPGNMPIDAG